MLKAVSSIINALGALNYKGTWNANTNSPALASGVGTKGDYYVVSVAGTTTLDGISNWGIGDWAVFNGSVWQRVEGGADLNGVNLSVTGTTTLSGLTASTALALNASKEVVSVTNTGSGNNVLATSPQIATPTLTGDVSMTTGNLVVGTSGKGIDFSATPGTGTSELFSDYEEGTWAAVIKDDNSTTVTGTVAVGRYTKIGRIVHCTLVWQRNDAAALTGGVTFNLPFANAISSPYYPAYGTYWATLGAPTYAVISSGVVVINAYATNIGAFVRGYSSGTTGYLTFGAGAENIQNGATVYSSFTYETNA